MSHGAWHQKAINNSRNVELLSVSSHNLRHLSQSAATSWGLDSFRGRSIKIVYTLTSLHIDFSMSSTSDVELSGLVELSTMLLQLLDSERDLSGSEESFPRSTSTQTLDISHLLTLVDSQEGRTTTKIKPQELRNQIIPTIILTTPSEHEMDIDTAPSWRDVQLPAHILCRDKGSGHTNGGANGNANDEKGKTT
ncbi:hypothetical protein GGI35DRAFT_330457 [Trichoderma velutinum]